MSVRRRPRASIIVSTYERPDALEAVLWALAEQADARFDVVVADDGSGSATRETVERWKRVFGDRLAHVWQPDEGYRPALARNRGSLAARGEYLVFLDGDCVPRRGFVRALRRSAHRGWFVAGRRLELSRALTERVLTRRIPIHRWSLAGWLVHARGEAKGLRALTPRDRRRAGRAHLPEFEPVERAYGFLLGVSRSEFERVNGYDARYEGWGEEDLDIAIRLRRIGLRCGWAGPGSTLLHLWHPQRDRDDHPNAALLHETKHSQRVEAVEGLRELAQEARPAEPRARG